MASVSEKGTALSALVPRLRGHSLPRPPRPPRPSSPSRFCDALLPPGSNDSSPCHVRPGRGPVSGRRLSNRPRTSTQMNPHGFGKEENATRDHQRTRTTVGRIYTKTVVVCKASKRGLLYTRGGTCATDRCLRCASSRRSIRDHHVLGDKHPHLLKSYIQSIDHHEPMG